MLWKNKKHLVGLLLILAIAIFFRLWQIGAIPPGLYPDEAMNGNNALETLRTGEYKVFYPENNGREGLFINIQSLSLRIFGNEPWALRLVSAIFGILTVLGLYFLTKELFKNNRIALFASFFMATSFWHIMFSRIGFRAIMAPAFLVWSLYLLFKIVNQTKNKSETRNTKHETNPKVLNIKNLNLNIVSNFEFRISCLAIFSGLLFGLGFHSYIAYRVAPLLLIPPFILLLKNKNYKPILIFLLGAFIAGLPLGLYFLHHPQDFFGRTSQISVFSADAPLHELGKNILLAIGMFFWNGDMNWRHNFAGDPELWWPIAVLFLLGLCVSVKTILKNSKFQIPNSKQIQNSKFKIQNLFLWIWFIVMLLPVVISSEGLPHALRAIIVIPPTMVFAALGINWLIEKTKNWLEKQKEKYPQFEKQIERIGKELAVLLAVFLLVITLNTYKRYFWDWASNINVSGAFSEDYAKTGKYLNSLPKEIPKYVIVDPRGVDVRGVPMPSQTIMFITQTFLPEWQKEKNIYYVLPDQIDKIPEDAIKVWIK